MTRFTLRRGKVAACLLLTALCGIGLTGCGQASQDSSDVEATSSEWPRTFTNADGSTTEIPAQPERVLSTTVTVTGTLLAIDAPVVASSANAKGQFFAQWADVAEERGVDKLWNAGEFDLEAVIASDPDLIVVASTGADQVTDQIPDLQSIAPTIVVDYGAHTWQDLAGQLGEATGLEEAAREAVDSFNELVRETAAAITVPDGQANIVSYNGAGADNPIGRAGGSHAELLSDLGFTIEDPDPSWHTQPKERNDFVFASYENLQELTANTTFILAADDDKAQEFANDPTLANVPSVAAGQVYGLGVNSFRMDRYSAVEVVEHIRELFA